MPIVELVGGPMCGTVKTVANARRPLLFITPYDIEHRYLSYCKRAQTGREIFLHSSIYDWATKEQE